ncbi:hypothetical protein ACTFIZ_008800 [Dictyostelium cf. discoideum]
MTTEGCELSEKYESRLVVMKMKLQKSKILKIKLQVGLLTTVFIFVKVIQNDERTIAGNRNYNTNYRNHCRQQPIQTWEPPLVVVPAITTATVPAITTTTAPAITTTTAPAITTTTQQSPLLLNHHYYCPAITTTTSPTISLITAPKLVSLNDIIEIYKQLKETGIQIHTPYHHKFI